MALQRNLDVRQTKRLRRLKMSPMSSQQPPTSQIMTKSKKLSYRSSNPTGYSHLWQKAALPIPGNTVQILDYSFQALWSAAQIFLLEMQTPSSVGSSPWAACTRAVSRRWSRILWPWRSNRRRFGWRSTRTWNARLFYLIGMPRCKGYLIMINTPQVWRLSEVREADRRRTILSAQSWDTLEETRRSHTRSCEEGHGRRFFCEAWSFTYTNELP